jgi:hypothetical protein
MLILVDQGTPVAIRHALRGHAVRTAREQDWSTLLNGDLLRVAEEAGFDVLLTTDTNLRYQQNLRDRKLAIVVLNRNRWSLVRPMLEQIVAAIDTAKPGTYTLVDIPVSRVTEL